MAEKLRRKFIIISTGAVFIVLFVIASFINISNFIQLDRHSGELIAVLSANNGCFPKALNHKDKYNLPAKMSPEAPFSTRFFTIKTDKYNSITSVDTGKISSATTKEAMAFAKEVLAKNKRSGFIKSYKYEIVKKDYGNLVIFVDCQRDLQMFFSFLQNSIIICLIGVAAVFVIVMLFSKKAIAPVAQSYEKQKQFITNASHELKTPLAIINANTEVLEMESGENEWTNGIHSQIKRLSQLIGNFVSLSKMDEEESKLEKTDFCLSDSVSDIASSFLLTASSKNKELKLDIEENIHYFGNEEALRRLVSILLDNAINYSSDKSTITLSLTSQGRKIILQTKNLGENLNKGNYDILFERFYRCDSSRNSQSGGHGIGLSIARAIAAKHKGKITAISPDGKCIIFTLIL